MFEVIERYTNEYKFSDIHLKEDKPLVLRINGDMTTPSETIISASELHEFANQSLNEKQKTHLEEVRDVDLAIEVGPYRFRANFFYTSNGLSAVLRKIETEIPSMQQLNLPYVMQAICEKPNGLVLVTGPTGSGKSTSLAALIGEINATRKGHIITVEDPIEYIHHSKACNVSQREIGRDAQSFASALRASLREDPDVILVGEMRDRETIQLALTAAETGHLVFGTLHTSGAPNTINRIIDVFPAEQQSQVRAQLSQSLQMVATQRLFKTADGQGRVAAFEIMVCNHAIRNLIRENKIFQIESIMQTARSEGMMTMDYAVEQLVENGQVTQEGVEDAH
ncbi:MAG TPA: type IV pilus twitching motility protein PilT [Piscirickettsiaceae bacterium]|nr:type IV pilus twitching motility protein PilT [Piscirickettsiaceae bacterium]